MSLAEYLAAGVVGLTVLALFGRLGWPFELFMHFRPQYAVLSVIAAIVGFAAGEQATGFVAAYCALSNAMMSRGWPTVTPRPELADKPGLTVVWANVWHKRDALDRTLDWARSLNADLVLIGEFPAIADDPATVAPDFPHVAHSGDKEAEHWRVVAYSRRPIIGVSVHRTPDKYARPTLIFSIDAQPGQRLNILAAHPTAPVTIGMLKCRDGLIRRLSAIATRPFLIAGDFNATPWSAIYANIPGARIGEALLKPTWISSLPLLGLPIDHLKVSPEVSASAYKIGPATGSDHRAVAARIHLQSL